MQKLLEAIREECSPATWSRAVTQARSGTLSGKRARDGSLEVRIATKGGMTSPLVTLSPEHSEWSCECPSQEPVCQHAAAAVILLAQAEKEGTDLLGVRGPAATLGYEFSAKGDQLFMTRMVKQGDERKKLSTRLIEERQKGEAAQISTSRADVEIDLLIGNMREGPVPRAFVPKLLGWLAECEDVTFEGKPIALGEPVDSVVARVERDREGFRLIARENKRLTRSFESGVAVLDDKLCLVREPQLSETDLAALKRGRHVPLNDVADLVGRVIPALRERIPVEVPEELLPGAQALPARLSLSADIMAGVLEVLPTIVYGDPPCARVDGGKLTYLGGPVALRDVDAELRLSKLVETKLGLEVGRRKRLEGEAALRLADRVRALDDVQISGSGLENFSLRGALTPELSVEGHSFALSFRTEKGERASAEAVVAAFQHGSPLVALEGGGFAPLPRDFLALHGHLVRDLLAAKDERDDSLPAAALVDLARLCSALDYPAPPELARLRTLSEDFSGIPEIALPEGVRADLRSYQLAGYRWLRFLGEAEMGALLADDMGLGKTLQALCALRPPALVVCPASVVFNWAAEIARFRPELKVCTYHGPQRALDVTADVTITTYAIMRMDAAQLSQKHWATLILDEAQTIKNPDSQVARAAYELPAERRIALTGTPVENRLTDLWSLFHFLNRGLLGGRADFEAAYGNPIAEGDREAARRLRARIKPFVLRRLKRDVVKELPPRTDVVLHCTLDDDERALYESVRAATQKDVVEQLESGGSVLAALEALLRLRQACCHRALLPGQSAARSSKLDVLLETLDEALSEGHKALVFSQWTSLLDLVEPHLEGRNVRFVRLDGSTADRAAVVREFQDDPGVGVMLLSLKAGGVGLNLTAADHVFLMDPWWNPAAEDQAADRAHRIGQDRPVLVHRLVAKDSVEERILVLQEKKRALSAVATDGAEAAAGITRSDLLELLR
ncbi:MAG: DEAD/DEAH box helicase [Myxococcales bacterium]